MMRPLSLIALALITASGLSAVEPKYSHDLTEWQEIPIPPESNMADYMAWFYAANYSKTTWCVSAKGGKPFAQRREDDTRKLERPQFTAKAGKYREGSIFRAVDDGWLIGFNQGEFGAALYWFNDDGTSHYEISQHQIAAFFSLPDGLYAIEGLAHLGSSSGSIIRLGRPKTGARWQATTVQELPAAPEAISLKQDGSMVLTLSDSLVSLDRKHKITTILTNTPWGGLYPNSSILSADEKKLYIGMRQFVGEFDLETHKLRFLIPSSEFLNKLPKEDEDRIRKTYKGKQ